MYRHSAFIFARVKALRADKSDICYQREEFVASLSMI